MADNILSDLCCICKTDLTIRDSWHRFQGMNYCLDHCPYNSYGMLCKNSFPKPVEKYKNHDYKIELAMIIMSHSNKDFTQAKHEVNIALGDYT